MGKSRRRNQNTKKAVAPQKKPPSVYVKQPAIKVPHYPKPAYYAAGNNEFYIYGQTVTKARYNVSKILGPFRHFRLTFDSVFAGDNNLNERVLFIKDIDSNNWVLADGSSYLEVIVATESSVKELEQEHAKRSTG